MWCMHRTNIYLDDAQLDALDRLAAEEGTSRSDVIRRFIDRALAGTDADVAGDLLAIEESFGALEGVVRHERGRDERSDHLDRMWRLGA